MSFPIKKARDVADRFGHKARDAADRRGHKTRDVADELGHKTRDYWRSVIAGEKYTGSDIASPSQIAYAELLDLGMKLGLAALVAAFALYVLGIVEPEVALDELPDYWRLSVHDYQEKTRIGTGWGWFALADKGDYLTFVPIAFLAGITVFCYARILPILLAERQPVFAIIVAAEIVVLLLAASGLLLGGH
jgi:hypothetical protein